MKNINMIVTVAALCLAAGSLPALAVEATVAKEKLLIQVSDADAGKWNLALNNAKNVQQMIGADKVDIEIVVYGPGIGMLKADSVVANRIEDAKNAHVTIVACENTMKGMKLSKEDMLSNTSYVPAGVVELMRKQREGYSYIRP